MIELSVKEPHSAKNSEIPTTTSACYKWLHGRQLHVQSYRDDGSMIKFSGLGGEIAISKDQVQTIRRAEEGDRLGSPSLSVN